MKTIKIIMLALAAIVCISISAISLIGMLCYYQTVQALPWAIGAAVAFMVALYLTIKWGELKNVE